MITQFDIQNPSVPYNNIYLYVESQHKLNQCPPIDVIAKPRKFKFVVLHTNTLAKKLTC